MKVFTPQLKIALFILITGVGAWLLLTAAYSFRSDFRLGIGDLGDAPYLSGFNGDEPGVPRYRWTGSSHSSASEQAIGVVTLPWGTNPAAANVVRVTLEAGTDRDPPQVQVWVNGSQVGQIQPDPGAYATIEFTIPTAASGGDSTRIEIRSSTFKPANDNRYLGVKVAEVQLVSSSSSFRRPPVDAWLWAWLYTIALGLVFVRLVGVGRLLWSAGAATILLIPWLLVPVVTPGWLNLWYTPYLLPFAALLALFALFVVWRTVVQNVLVAFLAKLESSPHLARNILLAVLLIYSVYALYIVLRMDYIGHADYADNAVAARNIVQGRGYSLDYVAQFYQTYTLPRPADTWPPLQPLMTVPFYLVFGATVWAAKLPNLILVPVLAWAIFVYGCRLFNRRTGLGAALLILVTVVPAFSSAPAVFETIAYPINDLIFTLLTLLVLFGFSIWLSSYAPSPTPAVTENEVTESAITETETPDPAPKPDRLAWLKSKSKILWLGLWCGLFFLSKPSGVILLLVAGVWVLWRKFVSRWVIPWRDLFLLAGVTLLAVSPFLIRNILQFHTLYFSTESYDTWVTKWNPPGERIYDLYTLKGLPNPRQLLEFGWDADFNAINNQFKHFFNDLFGGNLFAPLLLVLAALGLGVLPRRRSELSILLVLSAVVYVIFFNVVWHYEARYFLAWVPPILLLAVYGLSWLYDKMNVSSEDEEAKPEAKPTSHGASIWLVILVFGLLAVPGLLILPSEGESYTTTTGIVTIANWLKQHTPTTARVMSRNIWELSFHSSRDGVMVPNNATLAQIKTVMNQYNVNYLELDHLDDRDINQQWGQRSDLWPLLDAPTNYQGFTLLYNTDGFLIYSWNGQ